MIPGLRDISPIAHMQKKEKRGNEESRRRFNREGDHISAP